MTEVFIIAWLWVVGIVPAYYAVTKGATREFSLFLLIAAHIWPLALPVFFIIGAIASRRPS